MERLDSVLRGLTVWWLVSVMAMVVEFLECCWGECRGFAQLREGSDDPPPPVRMGASAWADATPRPASRLIRTVIIAMMRRRRETRCMKPKPLHQTPNGIYAACLSTFCLSTPTLHQIAGANGVSQSSSRRPPLFTLPPDPQTTHDRVRVTWIRRGPASCYLQENGASSLNRQAGISRCSAGRRRLLKRCRGSGR